MLQRAIAEQERDRAEENFREARDAVDRFSTKVSEEDLLRAEGLQPLRKDLLEQALVDYRNYASSLRNAGRIEDAARQYDEAAAAYRRMLSAVEPDQSPLDSPYHDEAAQLESWRAAAHALCRDGDAESRALAAFEEACRAVASDEARAAAVVALRAASVEAWCDAVTRMMTVDPARASAMMARAESELRAAEAAARGGEDLAEAIETIRRRVAETGATLRTSSE